MTDENDLQELAAEYASCFDFDFGDSGIALTLSEDAPPELVSMIKDVLGDYTQESLVKVYESLNIISEAEDVFSCEIDEKVCPLSIFCRIARWLDKTNAR
ncbi:hypothetical protein [Desulfovibrio gilichinskyi]|uniref:Uncharacterized protein n=1 Tax=Desulfovibrio gilichinskyi TaxID=1519643 RepID=A0A1X7DKQ0_9BACT|nr:hypothetical protein [Desulfovibrio gilichinskyi]SMF17215.1 hypothetical protein SAMN06295933_2013 [Desulfovibrio gilichinskyi]